MARLIPKSPSLRMPWRPRKMFELLMQVGGAWAKGRAGVGAGEVLRRRCCTGAAACVRARPAPPGRRAHLDVSVHHTLRAGRGVHVGISGVRIHRLGGSSIAAYMFRASGARPPPRPHLGMHVLQRQEQLHKFEHELVLPQQRAAPRLDQLLEVALLRARVGGRQKAAARLWVPHARVQALQRQRLINIRILMSGSLAGRRRRVRPGGGERALHPASSEGPTISHLHLLHHLPPTSQYSIAM